MTPSHTTPETWRKSSYSTAQANCVELAETPNGVFLRDSKHPGGGALTFSRAELAAFIAACRAGELDQLL
jgi:hypothetical protein